MTATPSEVRIDGSLGEGGGQVVRTSLALSLVTGKPVTITNIRAGRDKPGLMRQHLTAVQAAVAIGDAQVKGAEIGSRELSFQPTAICPGSYAFSIGTAGSTTLVLQTVLPALLIANAPSELILEGGTHNPWAPPYSFLERSFIPLINRMGPKVTVSLERHGFHPVGGGRFVVRIEPVPGLAGFDLLERGAVRARCATALVANLPRHIGEREIEEALRRLSWSDGEGRVEIVDAHGPGNVLCVDIESDNIAESFTAFGRIGISAKGVADEVVRLVRSYMAAGVPVGTHLADQILLPLGVSAWQSANGSRQQGGSFCTLPLSRHAMTQIEILRHFLNVQIVIDSAQDARPVTVSVLPVRPTDGDACVRAHYPAGS